MNTITKTEYLNALKIVEQYVEQLNIEPKNNIKTINLLDLYADKVIGYRTITTIQSFLNHVKNISVYNDIRNCKNFDVSMLNLIDPHVFIRHRNVGRKSLEELKRLKQMYC